MVTIICVLRSGGVYDQSWVDKLRYGCERHLKMPFEFACLSDVEVDCRRIALAHDWPGWWSKIELFRPGVISGPTLYLDLDTLVVGDFSIITSIGMFSMLKSFARPDDPSCFASGVMWFPHPPSPVVYQCFRQSPQHWIRQYPGGAYGGDQAFIADILAGQVIAIQDRAPGVIRLIDEVAHDGPPPDCGLVVFKGFFKQPHAMHLPWVERAWQ